MNTDGATGVGLLAKIITVNGTIAATNAGVVDLSATNNSGGLLTVNADITTTANVYLQGTTGVTETGAAKVTAATLGLNVKGVGNITANNGNLVNVVGAKTSNGNIQFKNAQNLAVTTVGSSGNFTTTSNGLDTSNTTGNTIDVLVSTGTLTLNNDVTTNTTGNVYLQSAGAISEAGAAKITTGTLGMNATAAGAITVNNGNLVNVVGAKTSNGNIQFKNAQNLAVTTVGSSGNFTTTSNGLDTSNTTGNTIDVLVSTGTLTLNNDVTTNTTGNVYLQSAGAISEAGAAKITTGTLGMNATAAGAITVNNGNLVNVVGAKTSNGNIQFKNAQNLAVTTVGSSGNFTTTSNGLDTSNTTGNTIDVLVSTGTLTLNNDVTTNTTGNAYLTANSAMTQSGGKIVTASLGLKAGGAIDVTTASNDVVTMSASTSSGSVAYRDANALTIGTVGAAGNYAGTSGVVTSGTAILLQTGGGLTLTQNITSGSGSDVRLSSGGGISQTGGAITAASLGMSAAGTIDVTTATNNAATLSATTSAGTINYRDADALTLGSVSAQTVSNASYAGTTGVTTTGTGSDILIQTSGAQSLTQNIAANSGTGGSIRLSSGGAITQTGGAITASSFGMRAAGAIDVQTSTNNAGTIAATTTAGTISYRDTDAVSIGNVGAQTVSNANFASTSGISTSSNVTLTSDGAVTQTGVGDVSATGLELRGSGSYTLANSTNAITTLAANTGSVSMRDDGGFNVGTVNSTVGINSTGAVTLTSAGSLGLNDNITAASNLSQNGGGTVAVGGTAGTRTLTASNGNISFANAITSSQPLTLNAGTGGSNGLITISGGLNSNSNAIVVNGTDWDFTGSAVGSINANTSTVTVSHSTDGTINLVASGAGLGTDDLARITTAATGTLYVGDSAKGDTVNVGGNVDFAVSTPNAEIRAASLANSSGRIGTQNIASHLLTISTTSGANTNVIGNSGTANVAVHNSGAGNIALNTATGNLNITRSGPAGTGSGTAIDAASGPIDLNVQAGALTTALNGGGMVATGNIVARSNGALTVNDAINTSSGSVKLVAGRASGMGESLNGVGIGEGAWGTAIGFQMAPMNINAPVRSGYTTMNGNISLYSTGPITQSATGNAGLQAFYTKPLEEGKFVAITFNDGVQAAPINLQNQTISAANPGAIGNCGFTSGTGNCAGPLILETRKAAGLIPPVSQYAESDINYKSISGTNIFGVGTAAAIQFVAPSQTINSSNLNGSNVFFYATAGNIDLNVQITNADINGGLTGGSLNLIAAGNVNVNAPKDSSKSGVAVGKVLSVSSDGVVTAEQFDHDLKIVATGDIAINGSVYLKGDLTFRANASAGEVNSANPGALPQASGGTGKVILTTQPVSFYSGTPPGTSFPLEIKANNITIGTKVGGTPQPVAGLEINASGPAAVPVAGVAQRADAVIEAKGALEVYVTGDIDLTAGYATAITSGKTLKSTAVSALVGDTMIIKGMGVGNTTNLNLTAGTAYTDTTGGGGAIASADAFLFSATKQEIDIGGSVTLRGGNTPKLGQSSAAASIDPNELVIRAGGDIVLIGGSGPNSSASITNAGDIQLVIGGSGKIRDISYTAGATPVLGGTSGLVVTRGVKTTIGVPGGLILIGGPGSGLFGANNVSISPGDQIKVNFTNGGVFSQVTQAGISSAFITANSARSYDSLLGYIIYAANEETRASRARGGLGASDDSNSPSCN